MYQLACLEATYSVLGSCFGRSLSISYFVSSLFVILPLIFEGFILRKLWIIPPPLDPSNFLPSRMISNYFFSYSLFLSMFFIRLTFDVYYLFYLYIYFCQTWFGLMVWCYMVEKPPQSNQSTTRQTLPFTHISFKGVREARIARIESYKYVLLG